MAFETEAAKNRYAETSDALRAKANCSRGASVVAEVADNQAMIAEVAVENDVNVNVVEVEQLGGMGTGFSPAIIRWSSLTRGPIIVS